MSSPRKIMELVANSDEWTEKNARRLDLAERRSVGALTPAEDAEFNELQAAFFAYLESKFPTPRIADGRLEALEEKYNLADTP